jgi:sulfatase maturation enzyme AslB (radical SAM superfamily)
MKNVLVRTARQWAGKLLKGRQSLPETRDCGPCTNPVTIGLRQELLARGQGPASIDPWLLQVEKQAQVLDRYDVLQRLTRLHPEPHQINYLLGQEEYLRGVAEMTAYPAYVLMDISNICTIECKFCKYVHNHHDKRWLSLEEIKKIEWLRHPLYLNFTAGTAEALSNPQFVPIFHYVSSTYPHLILGLLTNGRTLNEKIQGTLEGRLHELHVSMNASSEEDYNRIIANGSWSLFSKNMKSVRDLTRRTKRPWVQASFVKMRWNLERAVRDLEFAVEHGAHKVLFHHFYPHYIQDLHGADAKVLAEKFGPDQSLYFDQERSDDVFASVEERARQLGVDVEVPPPFKGAASHILWGARSRAPSPKDCAYPWTHLFMIWGWKSKREEILMCCGLASDTGIYFDWQEVFTKNGLMKTWNSPTMQAYRRTVNGTKINPICAACRKTDRFNPGSVYVDQRKFFEFANLPVPPHFKEGKWPSLNVVSGGSCS